MKRSERYQSNAGPSTTDIIIIENYFYSPISSTLGGSSSDKENKVKNNENQTDNGRTTANIKRRIRNTWNNAKYDNQVSRWILQRCSNFDHDQPLWHLGKMYSWQSGDVPVRSVGVTKRVTNAAADAYEAFYDDFTSRIWFTYRKDFMKLNGCRLRSDCGWGCMLRCGQMLLAQSLICHILGRDWTLSQSWTDQTKAQRYRRIVECFLDSPNRAFSIHTLVEMGLAYGKQGGDWYGPASTAFILRDALANRHLLLNADLKEYLDNLAVYVATDGVVYLDEVGAYVHSPMGTEGGLVLAKALLLIIPLRLGTDKLNPVYIYHLKTILSMKCCVGVMGGRPKHSMYFVGWQTNSLIYLDPHYCQDALREEQLDQFSMQTFHCKWPRKIEFADTDPSCAVGFYLRPGTNMSDFISDLSDIVECTEGNIVPVKYPLFAVTRTRPAADAWKKNISSIKEPVGTRNRRRCSSTGSCRHDFVFL